MIVARVKKQKGGVNNGKEHRTCKKCDYWSICYHGLCKESSKNDRD